MLYGIEEEDREYDDEDSPLEDVLTVAGPDPDEYYLEEDEKRAEAKRAEGRAP